MELCAERNSAMHKKQKTNLSFIVLGINISKDKKFRRRATAAFWVFEKSLEQTYSFPRNELRISVDLSE